VAADEDEDRGYTPVSENDEGDTLPHPTHTPVTEAVVSPIAKHVDAAHRTETSPERSTGHAAELGAPSENTASTVSPATARKAIIGMKLPNASNSAISSGMEITIATPGHTSRAANTAEQTAPSTFATTATINVKTSGHVEGSDQSAVRIQALYRGHQGRKEVASFKQSKTASDSSMPVPVPAATEHVEETSDAPIVETASAPAPAHLSAEVDGNKFVKFQAVYRGHKGRKEVAAIKQTSKAPAVAVGKTVTDPHLAPQPPAAPQADPEKVIKFQAVYRGHKGRKEVAAIKQTRKAPAVAVGETVTDPHLAPQPPAAPQADPEKVIKFQAVYRGHRGRKEVANLKQTKVVSSARMEESDAVSAPAPHEPVAAEVNPEKIVKFQAVYRGHQGRKQVASLKQSKGTAPAPATSPLAATPATVEPDHGNIVKFQAVYRGHRDRKEVATLKQSKSVVAAPAPASPKEATPSADSGSSEVVKIQAAFRGHNTRNSMKSRKDGVIAPATHHTHAEDNDADSSPMAPPMTIATDKAVEEIPSPTPKPRLDESADSKAVRIQSVYRGHRDRQFVMSKKAEKTPPETPVVASPSPDVSAVRIQAAFRGHSQRKTYLTLQQERAANLRSAVMDNSVLNDTSMLSDLLASPDTGFNGIEDGAFYDSLASPAKPPRGNDHERYEDSLDGTANG
jgi:ribosomal protein L25 (general stress protein Ctc)